MDMYLQAIVVRLQTWQEAYCAAVGKPMSGHLVVLTELHRRMCCFEWPGWVSRSLCLCHAGVSCRSVRNLCGGGRPSSVVAVSGEFGIIKN